MKKQNIWTDEELKLLKEAIANGFSPKETAELFPNRTFNSVNVKRKRVAREVNKSLEQGVERDLSSLIKKEEENDFKKKYTFALKQLKEKDELLKYHVLLQQKDIFIYKIQSNSFDGEEATPVLQWSDWHIEEEVKKEKVDGVNEYNLDIAKQRINNLIVNDLRLCKMQQKEIPIKDVIISLQGDFISGNIHDELLVNCQVPPIEAIDMAQNYIASGIQYFLDNSEFNLIIPCVVGNHARITKKIYSSSEQENSLEYSMYKNLARRFEKEERVKFIIPNSNACYIDVYGETYLFAHGHQFKYRDAISGIHTSLNKWLLNIGGNKNIKCAFLAHWHQYLVGNNYVVNGSLIGTTPFTKDKFRYEEPKQSFTLIIKGRGKTLSAPVFVD